MSLTPELAASLARLPLDCVGREYPNKLDHVLMDERDVRGPRALHPAFYGCFDWHSSVHGHWMLVRLLRRFALPQAEEARARLRENLTAENLRIEAEYLGDSGRRSFERMYGWAWLLKLAQELRDWEDEEGRAWAANLRPLEEAVGRRYHEFLPKQTYPIRVGTHTNTAFGLTFALDYARAVGDEALGALIESRARDYYAADRDYPLHLEPGGADFLSPGLAEADLMRRVMLREEFADWFTRFLPSLESLPAPATVSDRSDPQIGHLDGLNLSRAWCLRGIASVLPPDHPRARALLKSAERHAEEGLVHVVSGHYEGEHWLASFAVYLLTLGD